MCSVLHAMPRALLGAGALPGAGPVGGGFEGRRQKAGNQAGAVGMWAEGAGVQGQSMGAKHPISHEHMDVAVIQTASQWQAASLPVSGDFARQCGDQACRRAYLVSQVGYVKG